MKQLVLALSFLFVAACAKRLPLIAGVKDISSGEYSTFVETKTQKSEVYDGLYNKLTVQLTRVDAEMTENILAYSAKLSQWSEAVYQDEKSKMISSHSTQTEFFLSFFVPEKKHDNLNIKKTTWKVYLDVNGQRYEGVAVRNKSLFLDLEAIYPHHNRWSTAYTLTFPVSTASTEGKNLTVSITGPIASTQVKF